MICQKCSCERNENYIENGVCFKCVYNEKVMISKESKTEVKKCKVCKKKISKGRWVFCSDSCLNTHKKENNNCHWTDKVKLPDQKGWKKRDFNFSFRSSACQYRNDKFDYSCE